MQTSKLSAVHSTFHVSWYAIEIIIVKPCLGCTEQVDLSREYWLRVFEPSLAAWEAGVTPNPDVWCNRFVWLYISGYLSELNAK